MTHRSQKVGTTSVHRQMSRGTKCGPTTQQRIIQPQERKEILAAVTTWINSEDFMLSETGQPQKDKHCTIPFTRGT